MTSTFFGLHRPVEGLTVVGEATRDAPPEIIELSFDIHSAGPNAVMAIQEIATRILQIRQALAPLGADQVEVLSGGFAAWPILQQPQMPPAFLPAVPLLGQLPGFGGAGMTPPLSPIADGPQLMGYRASASVKVTLRDAVRVGEVIDTVTRVGALPGGSIRFLARNENEIRRSLLEEAIQEARGKANTLAAASGRTTGNPVAISEDFVTYQPLQSHANGHHINPFAIGPMLGIVARMPFTPGQLTFCARVSVTYQLQ